MQNTRRKIAAGAALLLIAGTAPAVEVASVGDGTDAAAVENLVETAIDAVLVGDRDAFLALYAHNPDHEALIAMYGDELSFEGPQAFQDWVLSLGRERRGAIEFYRATRNSMTASATGIDEPSVERVDAELSTWRGMDAADAPVALVALNHELEATFTFGRAVELVDGWAFVEAPRDEVRIRDPEPVGADLDTVDVERHGATLP